jgi:hypothetical protein
MHQTSAMRFDRSDIEPQIIGDHLIGAAVDDRFQHLSLAPGQRCDTGGCIHELNLRVGGHGGRREDLPSVPALCDCELMGTDHVKKVTNFGE